MPVNIMIAEDERIFSWDLRNSLGNLGYNIVKTVYSPADAINYAVTSKPDLILMDIKFGGSLSGIEAANFINSKMNVPVIFISAFSPDSYASELKKMKHYSFHRKPVDILELDAQIKTLISKSAVRPQ
jgi:DNA-binding NarL/FixJ family response regulator